MNFASNEKVLSFEATYDSPSLFVAMSVYDDSGVSPSLIQGPSAMLNFAGNSYRGKFTPSFGKTYLIFKAVYTDGTYITLHPDYAASTETVRCDEVVVDTAIPEIIGVLKSTGPLKGFVKSGGPLFGVIKNEC